MEYLMELARLEAPGALSLTVVNAAVDAVLVRNTIPESQHCVGDTRHPSCLIA